MLHYYVNCRVTTAIYILFMVLCIFYQAYIIALIYHCSTVSWNQVSSFPIFFTLI